MTESTPEPFTIHVPEDAPPEFHIAAPTNPAPPNTIALFPLIKTLLPGTPLNRRVQSYQLYLALGKLRAAQLVLNEYNTSIIEADEDKARYARHHAVSLFSVLGFRPQTVKESVSVLGLNELVIGHREAIATGNIEFDGLGELYVPGSLVAARTGLAGGSVKAGYRVVESWFEEKKTLFKNEKFGQYFAVVEFEEVYSDLEELGVAIPIAKGETSALETLFRERGTKCAQFTQGAETKFVEYHASSFFIHGGQASKRSLVPSASSGRIVIDGERSDEITLAMAATAGRYKRVMGESGFNKDTATDAPPPSADNTFFVPSCSFGGKKTQSKFEDIVAGKSGGSVFLLHGPPGVGKTLTAEAIAELLHKPLYYVTMGELGTNPEEMEKRWDALAIIDEADVFLEKRGSGGSSSDVVRNAMVCVMLRLLEYHQGILFLTTNRSRVTVALRYDHLDPAAREQVWRNLMGKLSGIQVDAGIDFGKLAQTVLNGHMEITSIGRHEMVNNAYSL
ncbi:hypothetical protein BCR33DRAFT_711465 [Rhizoclosmatium globosum]|uniref:AAA+ ATPase domain-containing protein n=1 Tax=Rhizoclosmatium globosum TaxID=329046 RepID=A0A1Y2D1E6_9FUNG|nr:hypothetical protein BCR33DRAFT_711465 [Rhizoclosmatium globosum]|eukprot:ORY53102.1 hypothetical protein BCR33DRAFT_711465 [Rhizoclosmatium globosum]